MHSLRQLLDIYHVEQHIFHILSMLNIIYYIIQLFNSDQIFGSSFRPFLHDKIVLCVLLLSRQDDSYMKRNSNNLPNFELFFLFSQKTTNCSCLYLLTPTEPFGRLDVYTTTVSVGWCVRQYVWQFLWLSRYSLVTHSSGPSKQQIYSLTWPSSIFFTFLSQQITYINNATDRLAMKRNIQQNQRK